MEEILLNSIIEELSKPENLKIIVKNVVNLQKEQMTNNSDLKYLINTKKQAQKALDNLVLAVEQGVVTKTTGQRIKELELQIEELERKIIIEQSNSSVSLTEEEIKNTIN